MYTPIIKSKPNDLKAWAKLTEEARGLTKPLVELLPVPPDVSTDDHLGAFANNLVKHCSSGLGPIFVDLYGLMPGATINTGVNANIAGLRLIRRLGRPVTPVYGLDRDDAVWAPLAAEVRAHGKGFCFRIDVDDLDDQSEDTWTEIIERTAQLGVKSADVDVLIDLRYVGQSSVDGLKELVLDFLAYKPLGTKYRSIIVAGSSALKSVSEMPSDDVGDLIRRELYLWTTLQTDAAGANSLGYGDYGVIHPNFSDRVRTPHINAKIRYTAGGKILVFRGHRLADPPFYGQYYDLAEQVRNHPVYKGRDFSFGDRYIDDCADHMNGGPGNLAAWVLADMNHHLEHAARQLAELSVRISADASENEVLDILEAV